MSCRSFLAGAFLGAAAFAAAGASAADICQTNDTSCPTTMPLDSYCECTGSGALQSGRVVEASTARQRANAAAIGMGRSVMSAPGYGKNAGQAGCGGGGARPSDPGCQ
ncbi:MAG: hypothetical protein JSR21_15455 [Proteobacteria bacterium]|nr:hypothetical protein [Pseudomonadota bacterium]